jgi:hypothetical protein
MERWSIYGLYDPRHPHEFRVIGKTKNSLSTRLAGYIHGARRKRRIGRRLQPSYVWIIGLLSKGIRPSICLIETCSEETWRRCERRTITRFRNRGHRLLNVHMGGNGRETGDPKLICDKCGCKRKRRANGSYYCQACYRVWRRTKATAYDQRYNRKYRETNSAVRVRDRNYYRDWRHARKLGLTVKAYRISQQS